jgi:outer membrane protein TolC
MVRRTGLSLALVGVAAVSTIIVVPDDAHGQLTLAQALQEADRGAYANRMARGSADADRARALAPLEGILPSARVEAGFLRTTDPIGAFGTTLRQREVTTAAFDPTRLNYPAPINNYQAGIVAELPLFNANAWAGRRAAVHGADASDARATWTRLETHANVIRAYYGAVLAQEQVSTLEAAAKAAGAHLSQAQAMVRQGIVTKSDALLASVRAGDIDVQLAEARGSATTARQQLAVLIGRSPGDAPMLPAGLPESARLRTLAEADGAASSSRTRADVEAAEAGRDAARADALRARATLLPRLNAFARYDWNAPAQLFAGERNWTLGVMATLPIFSGGKELAAIRGAAGQAAAAQAGAEAALAQAELDDARTSTALAVALERLAIAERAVSQGAEAQRLVERRYAGGLAAVTELLDAQASATASALAYSAARYGVISALADRRQALGADPGELAMLDVLTPPSN